MIKKISRAIINVSAITLFISFLLILGVLYNYFTIHHFSQQKLDISIISHSINRDGLEYFQDFDYGNSRITIINPQGEVLFDSEANLIELENHSDRIEFQLALETGFGESIRYSDTLMQTTLYTASLLESGEVIRISNDQLSVLSLATSMLLPFLLIWIILIISSIVIGKFLANKLVMPINSLDLDHPYNNKIYDEFSPLITRLHIQQEKITSQIDMLTQKNSEITYLTENVNEGILILDHMGMILSANKKCKELIGCVDGGFYLDTFRNGIYRKVVEDALNGHNTSNSIPIQDSIYRFFATAAMLSESKKAVFLFINDITEEEQALEMRRQFTANVSHELKTPLASIMGSAEIIGNGIAKTEDIPHFANKIREESARLLELIQDIIKISRIDEGAGSYDFSPCSLLSTCKEVECQLDHKAKNLNITLSVSGDTGNILGVPTLIHEIIFNLCDNAITYNKDGGTVELSVLNLGEQMKLSVKDSGVGIAPADIDHVFQRFYRVDKSRAKSSGGSGLGLSIVKHGVALHKGELSIESIVDKGTTIEILFNIPKEF